MEGSRSSGERKDKFEVREVVRTQQVTEKLSREVTAKTDTEISTIRTLRDQLKKVLIWNYQSTHSHLPCLLL